MEPGALPHHGIVMGQGGLPHESQKRQALYSGRSSQTLGWRTRGTAQKPGSWRHGGRAASLRVVAQTVFLDPLLMGVKNSWICGRYASLRIGSEKILIRAQSLLFHLLAVCAFRTTGCFPRRDLGNSPFIHDFEKLV
jgi:hypothetical protein